MKNDIPIKYLESVDYINLPSVCEVFNLNTTEYHLWVHLPESVLDFTIYEVKELGSENDLHKTFYCREHRPWIRFIFDALNKKPGKHTYRIGLVNASNDDVVSLYFSYIIQNDNPEKSYIYMNNSCCCK